jgi:replication factor C subunit 2/4
MHQVVRKKIKGFAQAACPRGGPSFKLLILDEADSLTQDAQAALRRTMEKYSRVTRFCFICNYVSRIIEPLASRCAKFRFKPLDLESMNVRLQHIADGEGVRVNAEVRACVRVVCACTASPYFSTALLAVQVLDALRTVSAGDLRKAITFLQSASQLYGSELQASYIIEIAGILPLSDSERLWRAIREPRFEDLRPVVSERAAVSAPTSTQSCDTCCLCPCLLLASQITHINAQGYALAAVLDAVLDRLLADGTLTDVQKSSMANAIAECDKCVSDGAEEELQLYALVSRFQRIALSAPPVESPRE